MRNSRFLCVWTWCGKRRTSIDQSGFVHSKEMHKQFLCMPRFPIFKKTQLRWSSQQLAPKARCSKASVATISCCWIRIWTNLRVKPLIPCVRPSGKKWCLTTNDGWGRWDRPEDCTALNLGLRYRIIGRLSEANLLRKTMENPALRVPFFPSYTSFVLSSIDFPALSTAVRSTKPQPWWFRQPTALPSTTLDFQPSAPRKALYPEVSHRQVRLLTAAHFFTIVPLHEVRGRMARYLRAAHSMLHVEGLLWSQKFSISNQVAQLKTRIWMNQQKHTETHCHRWRIAEACAWSKLPGPW